MGKGKHCSKCKFILDIKHVILTFWIPRNYEENGGAGKEKKGHKMWDFGSVVNLLYWSAATSSSGLVAVAKWTSVADNI